METKGRIVHVYNEQSNADVTKFLNEHHTNTNYHFVNADIEKDSNSTGSVLCCLDTFWKADTDRWRENIENEETLQSSLQSVHNQSNFTEYKKVILVPILLVDEVPRIETSPTPHTLYFYEKNLNLEANSTAVANIFLDLDNFYL